jgi:anaerobic carbon-monoxide dehydrogenase iron sulfur subunit
VKSVIFVEADKCTGCRICEVLCSLLNMKECNPARTRIHIKRTSSNGMFYDTPLVCQQCEDMPCAAVCPEEAIGMNTKTGIVYIDRENCTGCSLCIDACPFNAIILDPIQNVAIKCELCESQPLCVEGCPTGALQYGN